MIETSNELYHWLIHGILASYTGLLTWLGKGVYNDVKELKSHQQDCKLDLANFKTEVSKEYSKETSTQASLARIHDQIEKMGDKFDVKADNIQTGMTAILQLISGLKK